MFVGFARTSRADIILFTPFFVIKIYDIMKYGILYAIAQKLIAKKTDIEDVVNKTKIVLHLM